MKNSKATAIAFLALFVALSGSAVAAKLITGKQIKNDSLTGQDVRNGSLAAADLSGSARESLKGNAGPAGAPGAPGPQGPAGPVNTAKPTPVEATKAVAPGQVESVAAFCPTGQNAVMGDASPNIAHPGAWGLNDARTSFFLVVANDSSISVDIGVTAWCVPSGSSVGGRMRSTLDPMDEIEAAEDELRRAIAQAK